MSHADFEGHYNLIVRDAVTLEPKRESGWFKNLITNIGLNRIGTGGIATHALVGSSSQPPAFTDTGMVAFIAAAAQDGSGPNALDGAQVAVQPYYGWHRRTYRFGIGVAAGNISEVGAGWSNGSGFSAFSRALVRDPEGNPTTMTILSDEVLDVVYELRLYSPASDEVTVFNIGSTAHTATRRASSVNDFNEWSPRGIFNAGIASNSYTMRAWSGPIGNVFQTPSGTPGDAFSCAKQTYVNNSLKVQFTASWPLEYGNVAAGGIAAVTIRPPTPSFGAYQVGLNPPILKDETKTLTLTFELSWGRKT